MRRFAYQLVLLLLLAVRPAAGAAPRQLRPFPVADTTGPPLDTARVLGQLFAYKRKFYQTMLAPSALGAVASNYSLAYSKSETTVQQVSLGLNVVLVGFFSYRVGKALVRLRRYRVGREHTLLALLANGHPLPRPVRQQLIHYLQPPPAK
ncbi:hypothetical protein GCM10022409_25770 [Hymenobacter glaciei]|uniref:Uncharacterized protein n=1 Tax=Hymenobacter glaciei TaxID=877209 RepID=A0ABP7UAI7_9BACT